MAVLHARAATLVWVRDTTGADPAPPAVARRNRPCQRICAAEEVGADADGVPDVYERDMEQR